MDHDDAAFREDVERVLDLFVRTDLFAIRSVAGQLDAGRAGRSKRGGARRVVRDNNGEPIHSVTHGGRKDAQTAAGATGHATTSPAATDRERQLWKSTIAAKLARLEREQAHALETAARLKVELKEVRNQLTWVQQILGSAAASRRLGLTRSAWEQQRNHLRAREADLAARRLKIVRTRMYEESVLWFCVACSPDRETQIYCFGSVLS